MSITSAEDMDPEHMEAIVKLSIGEANDVFVTINNILSKPKTVIKGLEILNSVLKYCNADQISRYVTYWLDICLKRTQTDKTDLKLQIVCKVIQISYLHTDISRKIIFDYMSKIFELCILRKGNNNELSTALELLAICMEKFGSWFTSKKSEIDQFLISFLDYSSDVVVEKAAIAFLYLQQVGNAGIRNINHINNFRESLQRLCATVHNLFDNFFENRLNIDDIERPDQLGINFKDISCSSKDYMLLTSHRIKNTIQFLKVMISKSFPVPREIPPMTILNVIIRGTSIHQCISVENTDNSSVCVVFCLLLNNIQIQLLDLLKICIVRLQSNTLPYSFVISKILIDSLRRSEECICFNSNLSYHKTLYISLYYWINISKSGLNKYFQGQLILNILKHIAPSKNEYIKKLIKNLGATENLTSDRSNNEANNSFTKQRDEILCQLTLDVLIALFSSNYFRADHKYIEPLLFTVISAVKQIITSTEVHPYGNGKCKSKLYKLISVLCDQEALKSFPFVLTINVLNRSLLDNHFDIARVCDEALNNLGKIIHTPVSYKELAAPKPHNLLVNEESTEQIESDNEDIQLNITNNKELKLSELDITNNEDLQLSKLKTSKDTQPSELSTTNNDDIQSSELSTTNNEGIQLSESNGTTHENIKLTELNTTNSLEEFSNVASEAVTKNQHNYDDSDKDFASQIIIEEPQKDPSNPEGEPLKKRFKSSIDHKVIEEYNEISGTKSPEVFVSEFVDEVKEY